MSNSPLLNAEVQGARRQVALLERDALSGPCKLLRASDHFTQAREMNQCEEVVVIRGTITVSP